jgi:NodT family efflux transporter outer membrane factor (OMF) lipoprotein
MSELLLSRNRLLAAAGLALAGWSVGPHFHKPAEPSNETYYTPEKETAPDTGPAAAVPTPEAAVPPTTLAPEASAPLPKQSVKVGADLPAQWWQVFKSPALDTALKLSLANSPTLAQATATLAQAQEEVRIAQAAFLPRLGADAGVQRNGNSEPGPQTQSTVYTLGLSASYAVDVFGGTRRAVEQQRALAEMQGYQLDAAWLTLTGNVVNEALTIASTRLQIATTQELIASDRKNLDLTEREFELGAAARTDVLTAESQLAVDLTTLPSLHQQLGAARDALAVLVGKSPADWSAPDYDIKDFTLPPEVPVSLPSRLVRQRPDVLASEAQLHSTSAAIGVAVAQEFPALNLTGSLSRQALTGAGLFHQFDTLWGAGGTLAAPLFQGGALRAQVRAARDAFTAQAASYQNTVLEALGQVADDLRALGNDADRLKVSQHALAIASESLNLQQISYTAGKTTVLQLIDAERTFAQAKLTFVTAEIQQYEDTADLLVALGGGWWNDKIESDRAALGRVAVAPANATPRAQP